MRSRPAAALPARLRPRGRRWGGPTDRLPLRPPRPSPRRRDPSRAPRRARGPPPARLAPARDRARGRPAIGTGAVSPGSPPGTRSLGEAWEKPMAAAKSVSRPPSAHRPLDRAARPSIESHAMTSRVSTGVERLDAMVGGGLLPGTLTVVYGATGIGKTHLGLVFA